LAKSRFWAKPAKTRTNWPVCSLSSFRTHRLAAVPPSVHRRRRFPNQPAGRSELRKGEAFGKGRPLSEAQAAGRILLDPEQPGLPGTVRYSPPPSTRMPYPSTAPEQLGSPLPPPEVLSVIAEPAHPSSLAPRPLVPRSVVVIARTLCGTHCWIIDGLLPASWQDHRRARGQSTHRLASLVWPWRGEGQRSARLPVMRRQGKGRAHPKR
jgi:hypothetical protein